MSACSSKSCYAANAILGTGQDKLDGMRALVRVWAARPLHRQGLALRRCASTQPPPPARPYRPQIEEERAAYRKPDPEPEKPPRSPTWNTLSRILNPFHEPGPAKEKADAAAAETPASRDPERGIAAAQRVVTSGVLDARYKAGARRWITLIIGLVVAIGLTPEVWRRTMMGEKRKEVPAPESNPEGALDEHEGKSSSEEA